jgi:hypothetical protein
MIQELDFDLWCVGNGGNIFLLAASSIPHLVIENVTGLVLLRTDVGRAMAQAVNRRPPTAEARVRSRVTPCGICGGQSDIGTGFSPSSSVFPCQFHSTGAPLLGKGQKIIIILIFIIGLHNKPHGCNASVASAAGPFTTKKKTDVTLDVAWKFEKLELYLHKKKSAGYSGLLYEFF